MDQIKSELSASVYAERKPYFQLNAEKFLDSVKNNTAPFLMDVPVPLQEDTQSLIMRSAAVRSAETGRVFRGTNQLLAQIALKEMASDITEPDTAIITYQQAKNHGTFIKKGSPHFTLTSYDAETKKSTAYRYFPVSAVADERKLPLPPDWNTGFPFDITIKCTDTDPEKYLGKYLAAAALCAPFETDMKTMRAFKENLEKDLEKSFAEGRHTRVFELGNKASEICRDTLRDMGNEFRENKHRTHEPVEQTKAPERRQSRESGYAR